MSLLPFDALRVRPRFDRRMQERRDMRAITGSSLFDPSWYRSRYPDVAQAGIDPLIHFLRHGAREGRSPGPFFNTPAYLERYPDVALAGTNPLAHYLIDGRGEGRKVEAVGGIVHPNKTSEPLFLPCKAAPKLSLVVMVHAFYADVFTEICNCLAQAFDFRFTLLVSVPDEQSKLTAEATVASRMLDVELCVRVAPNRGRNFAPLLCLFPKEVLRHDLLLHVHTKKSLFTGSEQSDWRSNLYRCLVGSKPAIEIILSRFEEDSELGVVHPSTWSGLPYWAHDWLGNESARLDLSKKIGVELSRSRGPFAYPVGGMFWARTDALRPLFEANLRVEDFPPEQGQTDGTIAHAIERSINLIAMRRSYVAAEIHYESGTLRRGWNDFNQHQYISQSHARFRDDARHYSVISFDIFDTLAARPALTPDSALRLLGTTMADEDPARRDFFERRKRAELRARETRSHVGDVSLTEIYESFERSNVWSDEAVSRARQIEEAADDRILQPRSPVIDLLKIARSMKRRVIIISDTYYERSFIENLLEEIGVLDDVSEIYLSSERGARKDRGDLFDMVLREEKIDARSLLHVGDNEVSDLQKAGDRGIAVFHVMNPTTLLAYQGFAVDPPAQDFATDILLGPSLTKFSFEPFIPQGYGAIHIEHPADIGYAVFGPLIFSFVSWIYRRAKSDGVDALAFLSREGFLLAKVYERLRCAFPDLVNIPHEYLYVSRRAVLLAAQANGLDWSEVFRGDYKGKLSGMLKSRLGLYYPDDVHDPFIQLPRDVGVVREWLRANEAAVQRQSLDENMAFRAYLDEKRLTDAAIKWGVVDIGYSATIQNALQLIAGRSLHGYYMATYQDAVRVAKTNGTAVGYFLDGGGPLDVHIPLVRHQLVLEAVLTAPHGQLLRFVIEGATARPRFKPYRRKRLEEEALTLLHDGILKYTDDLVHYFGSAVLQIEADRTILQEPLRHLGEGAVRTSSRVKQLLKVEDEYCGYTHHDVGSKLSSIM